MDRIINASLPGLTDTGRARLARIVAALGLAAQLSWILIHRDRASAGWYDIVVVSVVALLVLSPAPHRNRIPVLPGRALLALAFLGSVADRFGLIGDPGAPGVSWGSFDAFVEYTRSVNTYLPSSWATPLAIAVTIVEIVLGIGVIARRWQPFAARVATCVLFSFGVAMSVSLGWRAPFAYDVWPLAGAAWMLAIPAHPRAHGSQVRPDQAAPSHPPGYLATIPDLSADR